MKKTCSTNATDGQTLHPSLAATLGVQPGEPRSPRSLLPLLGHGDPLALRARGRRRLARRGVFLSPRHLRLRVQARVALEARAYGGEPGLASWLDRCIDRSIDELVDEQHREETLQQRSNGDRVFQQRSNGDRAFQQRSNGDRAFQHWVAPRLGVEIDHARLACVALNALPEACRRAFFALEIEGRTPEHLVAEGGGTPRRVREHARQARRAVLDAIERRRRRASSTGC